MQPRFREPRFRWTCSYQGTTWFEVSDETGTYELELRRAAEPYELAGANGDDCRRDMLASIGLLRTSRCGDRARLFEVSRATLDAFNAWRLAEHREHMARLDAQPDRYGFIAANDPLRQPPLVAWRGFYVIGPGWQRSDDDTQAAA